MSPSDDRTVSYTRNENPNKINKKVNGIDHKAFSQILNARQSNAKMPLLFKMRKDISPPYSHKILAIHEDHITFLNLQTNRIEDYAFPPFLVHIIQEIALSRAHLMMGGLMDVLSPEVVASMDPQQVPSTLDPFQRIASRVSKEDQDNAVTLPDPLPHVKSILKKPKKQKSTRPKDKDEYQVHEDGPFAKALEEYKEEIGTESTWESVKVEVKCDNCDKPFLQSKQLHRSALKDGYRQFCGKTCRTAAHSHRHNNENSDSLMGRNDSSLGIGFTKTLEEATELWEEKLSD